MQPLALTQTTLLRATLRQVIVTLESKDGYALNAALTQVTPPPADLPTLARIAADCSAPSRRFVQCCRQRSW